MCLKTKMAKMLYRHVIDVTGLAWLHRGEEDLVVLRDGHWSNFALLLSTLEDVQVIKLAEIVETTIEACPFLI